MAKVTAKKIAKDAGLSFEHVLYRRTGDWYHVLNKFPAALLDEKGYLPFHTATCDRCAQTVTRCFTGKTHLIQSTSFA